MGYRNAIEPQAADISRQTGTRLAQLLLLLVQHLIYEHVVVVDRNTLTQLLFVSQRDCVRLPLGVSDAALQVGVVEALPPAQAIPSLVEPKAWHQYQVQTSCEITTCFHQWLAPENDGFTCQRLGTYSIPSPVLHTYMNVCV